MAGTRVGVGSPAGYPTLKTLVVTPALQHAGVEVFGQGSKKESLILQVVVSQHTAPCAAILSAGCPSSVLWYVKHAYQVWLTLSGMSRPARLPPCSAGSCQ